MARSVRLNKPLRYFLSVGLFASWTTGLTFFIMNRWVEIAGEFGPQKHPWQTPILKVHGAAAFLMMVLFGYLLASHVSVSWPVRRMRPLGLILVSAVGFLILSAYGLYYTGNDTLRIWLGYAHAGTGFSLPMLLAVHLLQGRWQKKRKPRRERQPAQAA